jgi:rubrerythrin
MVYVRGDEMLSKIPIDVAKLRKEELDKEILRIAMIAELDAINLYEQMAAKTKNKRLRALLLDVAREEKTHVGEFQTLLLKKDREQDKELTEGKKEVDELLKESKRWKKESDA